MLRKIRNARTLSRNDRQCERDKVEVENLALSIENIAEPDSELEAQLDFYKSLPEVEVEESTQSYMHQANSETKKAFSEAQTLSSTLKSKFSSINSYQSNLISHENSQISIAKRIFQARKKTIDTFPFSKERKQLKEQISSLSLQKMNVRRQINNMSRKIAELKADISEKKEKLQSCVKTAKDTDNWRKKAKPILTKQFAIVDKIKAKYQFFKKIADLNDPNINPNAQQKAIDFCKTYESASPKFTISLTSPLREYSGKEIQEEQQRLESGEKPQLDSLMIAHQELDSSISPNQKILSKLGTQVSISDTIHSCLKEIQAKRDKKIAAKKAQRDGKLPDLGNPEPVR